MPDLPSLASARPGGHRANLDHKDGKKLLALPVRLLSTGSLCRHDPIIHPAKLTGQLKKATTIEALLCIHRVHESHFNEIHLSACWTSLSQLARQGTAKRSWHMELLVQHTVQTARAGELHARQLANVVYGVGSSGGGD